MLVLGLCLLAVVGVYLRVRVTPEELRTRIDQELPVGSSADQVLHFLDSLRCEHSDVFSPRVDTEFPGAKRMITAAIRGFRKGNLLAAGVFMTFVLDNHDKLVRYKVEYGYTSL